MGISGSDAADTLWRWAEREVAGSGGQPTAAGAVGRLGDSWRAEICWIKAVVTLGKGYRCAEIDVWAGGLLCTLGVCVTGGAYVTVKVGVGFGTNGPASGQSWVLGG